MITIALKCTVFEPGAWDRQTDRRPTDRRIAALLNAPYHIAGEILGTFKDQIGSGRFVSVDQKFRPLPSLV